jgi:hypothetical protein
MAIEYQGSIVDRTYAGFPGKVVDPRDGTRSYAIDAPFTWRADFTPERTLIVELRIDVEDGAPVCNAVRVERCANEPSLGRGDLEDIPVAILVEDGCRAAARVGLGRAEGEPQYFLMRTDERTELTARPRKRTAITSELLRRVAETYVSARTRGAPPTVAVAEKENVSLRTASRWVSQAKERFAELFMEGDET